MKFYAYTRVSTRKQSELGVSLREQRDAIATYAQKHGLTVAAWFEECVTAAKEGRPVFAEMMSGLKRGKAQGVIIHKIDRSARNLRDWTELNELIDAGVAVHFANESLDLHSRGGRLSADIQAIVAADYVRNLREEIIKGIRGRLKEGLIPFGAPLGYLDSGKGKAKTIDPLKGPLVRQAFELYAAGEHTLDTLAVELHRRGLRNKRGNGLCLNSLSVILNNSFYAGLIRVKATGETYQGAHKPLIGLTLFKQVQLRLAGKIRMQGRVHDFAFRGLFKCSACSRTLLGEVQKGHRDYRCHSRGCPTKTFRQEVLEAAILDSWPAIAVSDEERARLQRELELIEQEDRKDDGDLRGELELQIAAIQARQAKLVDALIDGLIDKPTFEQRKHAFLVEEASLRESITSQHTNAGAVKHFILEILELASAAQRSYEMGDLAFRRELVLKLCSNRTVSGNCVVVEPHPALAVLAKRGAFLHGAPHRYVTRTFSKSSWQLWRWAERWLKKQEAMK